MNRSSDQTLMTMPWVNATMMPRITMNATHPATSRMVSFVSASLLWGGRKNSAGMSFMCAPRRSGDVGAVGAGGPAHDHQRQYEEHGEADLEDDEPGAKSHQL